MIGCTHDILFNVYRHREPSGLALAMREVIPTRKT